MMRFRRLRTVIALAFIAVVMGSVHAGADPDSAAQTTVARTPVDLPPDMQPGTDPFLWLEQVHGAQALAWVESENAKTFAALDKDQNYQAFYDDTLAISQSKDRVPQPEIIGGEVYNFWRDDVHVRGILRRATLAVARAAERIVCLGSRCNAAARVKLSWIALLSSAQRSRWRAFLRARARMRFARPCAT